MACKNLVGDGLGETGMYPIGKSSSLSRGFKKIELKDGYDSNCEVDTVGFVNCLIKYVVDPKEYVIAYKKPNYVKKEYQKTALFKSNETVVSSDDSDAENKDKTTPKIPKKRISSQPKSAESDVLKENSNKKLKL